MSEHATAQWALLEIAADKQRVGAVYLAHYLARAALALGPPSREMLVLHGDLLERADPLNATLPKRAEPRTEKEAA